MGEFIYIRKATQAEKPVKTNRGYSVWKCSCGNTIIVRNDCIPKVCSCNRRDNKKLTFNEKKEIVGFYQSKPMTIENVCEKFDISEPTVIKVLNMFDCKRWSKSILFSPELDEKYFENIDTQNKAYFLGLLITDGNVYIKNNTYKVSLYLQECDKDLIEQFSNEVNSNKQVTTDGRGCYGIQIVSQKMCEDLKKYSIVPNKTFTITLPKINDDLMSHFLRGCIDGDGSIGFYPRKNRRVHRKIIRLCSASKIFLEQLKGYLYDTLNLNGYIVKEKNKELWQICFDKNEDLYKLINYLYKDSNIFIKRKYSKSMLIKNELENTEITKKSNKFLVL